MRRKISGNKDKVDSFLDIEEKTIKRSSSFISVAYSNNITNSYTLLDDAYRSSGGFVDGSYLIPHPVESADKYARRQNMSYYINYVKPLVDAHVNPIFNNDPVRTGMDSVFSKFVNDVDGSNTSLTRFMKKAAIRAKLHGVEFIVVDMEPIDNESVISQLDVERNRLYPYLYLVSPQNIVNHQEDKYGRLLLLSYKSTYSTLKDDGTIVEITETCTWTPKSCTVSVGGETIRTIENKLGIIPVVPLYGTINDSNELLPQSDFYAIVRANLALYNACSELRERNRAQAFSLLTYPVDKEDNYEDGLGMLSVGTADALMYKAGGLRPEYITPPTDSSDIIQNEIESIKREIYRMAEMQFATQEQVSNVSGLSKAYDNQQLYQSISELSQGCQEAEVKISKIFSAYMGKDSSAISIVYNKEFGIVDSTEVLNNAIQALSLNICKDFNIEMKKQVIRAVLKDVDNSVITNIEKDLDNSDNKGDPLDMKAKVLQPTG